MRAVLILLPPLAGLQQWSDRFKQKGEECLN